MTKIYTRTGDAGQSSLYGGERVRKDATRLAAYGTIDELNSVLGVVQAELSRWDNPPQDLSELLTTVQHRLFDLGAELATPRPADRGTDRLGKDQVAELEAAIDRYDAGLPELKTFVLPGGCAVAAWLHLARGVCRRAERWIVALNSEAQIRPEVLAYVNRLGDLLFVLARAANQAAGVADVTWKKSSD